MAVLTADFETGTHGNSVSTGDTGSATAWEALYGAGPAAYSNVHAAHGTLSCFCPGGIQGQLAWEAALGTVTDHYGRAYMYVPTSANNGVYFDIVRLMSGATAVASINFIQVVSPTAKLEVYDNFGINRGTSTTTIPVDQWVRIEWHVTHSLTVGVVSVRIYTSADSTTLIETLTASNFNFGASAAAVRVGNVAANRDPSYIDNIVVNATAFPGPFPVNTTAPTVSGLTPVGSTLTATTGTWNSGATFTYTYQWTRAGVNIGGATSSTYATQAADAGTAVGCKVTATGQQATNEAATQASSNTVTVDAPASASTGYAVPPNRRRARNAPTVALDPAAHQIIPRRTI